MTPPVTAFATTAAYYARYRPHYPEALYQHLTRRFHLDGTQTVLDLGTGPGIIAVPLARLVSRVFAVDPDPDMLIEGAAAATRADITNILWRLGDSAALPLLKLPPLDLTTIGKAFHWMNREQTITDLDRITKPGGAVALISPHARPGTPRPPWESVIEQARTRYLGPRLHTLDGPYPQPAESHEDVLARSPFPNVETVTWQHTVTRTLDELIGLQLSQAYSSPALLGPHQQAFETDLRQALAQAEPSGRFTETIPTTAIIAGRSEAATSRTRSADLT